MADERIKRIRLIRIWEMLQQETDEEHPMDSVTLLSRLEKSGIECDRRTLYNDIKILNDYGYEILCNRSSTNKYYVVDRKFDVPEVQILMDAVQAASFITEKKTEVLIDKVAQLAGSQRGEVLKNNVVAFNTTKSDNEMIYYSVNEITSAILSGKKVGFLYFDYDINHQKVYRKNKEQYIVNPLATIFSENNYYLLCYDDKHRNLSHYRVDRMDRVTVSTVNITESKHYKKKELINHKNQVFNMFVGKTEHIMFEVDTELLDVIFDKFGDDIAFTNSAKGKVKFEADVQISTVFFGWCLSFGDKLKVCSPAIIVEKIKEYVKLTSSLYLTV